MNTDQPTTVSQQPSASQTSVVTIPAPQVDRAITVSSVPGGSLHLEFDLAEVSVSRQENSLIFEKDGGTIEVKDFFVVGDKSLPQITLADGLVVDPASVFIDIDMTTAADAPKLQQGGGVTDYSDQAGVLIDGVGRLDKLSSDIADPTAQLLGSTTFSAIIFNPGGTFQLAFDSSGSVASITGVYEDGQPYQNTNDDTLVAGKISLIIDPDQGSTATQVRFADLPAGAKLYLGDPNSPDSIEITPVNGIYTLPPTSFTVPGVYILPPANSDADFNFTIMVDFTSNGGTNTVVATGTVIVDAVADATHIANIINSEMVSTHNIALQDGGKISYDNKGFAHSESDDLNALGHDQVVSFTVNATFSDFQDGSESHFILIELPKDWINSAGYAEKTIYVDESGNPVHPDAAGNWPAGSVPKQFLLVPVDNDDIASDGSVAVKVECTIPANTKEDISGYEIIVISGAEENLGSGSGKELDLSNNLAFDQNTTTVSVNTFNGSITITAGWTYENHAEAGTGHSLPQYFDYVNSTDIALGAPISLSFTAQGNESITSVELTCPASSGGFYDKLGNFLGTKATVTYDDLQNGNVFFRASGSSDADVEINYSVTVSDTNNTTYTVSGKVPVVIDAVANANRIDGITEPNAFTPSNVENVEHKLNEKGYDVGTHKGTDATDQKHHVAFDVTASFEGHQDSSEVHYLLISMPSGWINSQNYATETVRVDKTTGNPVNKNPDGTWPGNSEDATFYRVPVSKDALDGSGKATLSIEFDVPAGTKENLSGYPVKVISVSQETNHSGKEYDLSNNEYYSVSSTDVVVNTVSSDVTIKAGWTYENHAEENTGHSLPNDFAYSESTNVDLGAPILLDFTAKSGEYVTGVKLECPQGSGGFYDKSGNFLGHSVEVSYSDLQNNNVFFRASGSSNADVTISYSVKISDGSNTSYSVSGNLSVVVDAVADATQVDSITKPNAFTPSDVESVDHKLNGKGFDTGTHKGTDATDQAHSISFDVTATFEGHLDSSEVHYLLIGMPEGWINTKNYSTETVRVDKTTGDPVNKNPNGTWPDNSEDATFYKIPVPKESLDSSGKATITIECDLPKGTKENITGYPVKVISASEVTTLSGKEYDQSNNQHYNVSNTQVVVNTLNSDIVIKAGWVYENNDGSAAGFKPNLPEGFESSSTNQSSFGGAPIFLEIPKGSNAGNESILNVALKVDPSKGAFYDSHSQGRLIPDANGYINISADLLKNGRVVFKPAPGYSEADVVLEYKLTINDNGVTYHVNGKLDIVVDAVANRTNINQSNISTDYGTNQLALTGDANETVQIKVKATFVDTSGSEKHYILVQYIETENGPWQCQNATKMTVYYDVNGKVLQPNGVDANGNFTYDNNAIHSQKTFWRVDVTDEANAQGGQAHEYTVTLVSPGSESDIAPKIEVGSVSEVIQRTEGGKEYDYSNNQAFDLGNEVTVKVETVDSELKISGQVFEDSKADAYLGDTTETLDGLTLSLKHEDGSASNDYFLSGSDEIAITLTFSCVEIPGTFYIGNVKIPASCLSDLGGGNYKLEIPANLIPNGKSEITINYTPPANSDIDLTDINYNVQIVAKDSGERGDLTGSYGTLIVDAVADKPVDVAGGTAGSGYGKTVSIEFKQPSMTSPMALSLTT